jgi:MFS transporter, FHS family, L-fucose permease
MERRITTISMIGYFFVGFVPIMLAPALPFLIRAFDLSLTSAGMVFVARSAGSFAGVLLGGVLADHVGPKPIVTLGCFLQGIMLGLVSLSGNWLAITAIFAVIGFSVGLINPAINAVIAEVNANARGAALNTLHGVYSIGAMIGPVVAGFLLVSSFGWRAIFWGSSAVWILYGFMLLFVTFPKVKSMQKQSFRQSMRMISRVLSPMLLLLFLVSFLYNGTATSLVSWINTYLDQVEFPILLGASMVSLFYLGLAIGRFACGYLSEKMGYAQVIFMCAIGSLLFYPVAVYCSQPIIMALGVCLAGVSFSGLHPTSLAYANQLYPDMGGTIASFLSIAMTLGAMGVPWVTGFAADRLGFSMGFGLNIILLVVLVLVAWIIRFWRRQTDTQP